jgi:hypothetical protein
MLKKAASFVLAALRGSTYSKEYASPPHLLRPRWTAFLTILQALCLSSLANCLSAIREPQNGFSTAC